MLSLNPIHHHHTQKEDTEALVCSLQVPQIHTEVVSRQVSAVVAVDGYGVDVVGVCIGEYSPGHGLDGDVVLDLHRHAEVSDAVLFSLLTFVCDRVEVAVPSEALRYLPQLDCLV